MPVTSGWSEASMTQNKTGRLIWRPVFLNLVSVTGTTRRSLTVSRGLFGLVLGQQCIDRVG